MLHSTPLILNFIHALLFLMMFWESPTHSRLFINSIHVNCNRFTNWDPSFPIELGDYGKVDKKTGVFRKYGNIFDDGKTEGTSRLRKTMGVTTSYDHFCSVEVRNIDFESGTTVEIPDLADAAFKVRFKIGSGGGAVLLQYKPTTSKLEGPIEDILTGNCDHLRKRHLVTEVVACPAYAMHLTVNKKNNIGIAFRASAPVPAAPGVNAGGELAANWYHDGHSDVFRCGSEPDKSYVTLYYVMEIGKKGNLRRDNRIRDLKTLGQECWVPAALPWKMLDEDGNEESEEDGDGEESDKHSSEDD